MSTSEVHFLKLERGMVAEASAGFMPARWFGSSLEAPFARWTSWCRAMPTILCLAYLGGNFSMQVAVEDVLAPYLVVNLEPLSP